MTEPLTTTEWLVLKAAAEDGGTLESIDRQIQSTLSPRSVPLAAVADALRALTERGLVGFRMDGTEPPSCNLSDLSCVWKASFAATPEGKAALASSKPAVPPGRSLFGVWKEHRIDLTLEDLAEVRREMWKSFPREFAE